MDLFEKKDIKVMLISEEKEAFDNENYIYEIVSKNIKKQRKLKGLTQEQLAQKMNYSTQFISNIESKNHQTFSLGTLWRLALVLDIDISLLFNEDIED